MVKITYITSRISLLVLVALAFSGCYNDKSVRNIEYAPNMYNSLPLEPYSQTDYSTSIGGNYAAVGDGIDKPRYFDNGLAAQTAPKGTVPRSESWYIEEAYSPYPYTDPTGDYEAAGANVRSPLNDPATNEKGYDCSETSFLRGKEVYEIYCVMCHGANGKGNGILVSQGVYPTVPAYADRPTITEGNMFHSITHGKGLMGSYASQITPQQRWEVICYIREFQKLGQQQ
ncbi:MAG: cytochrome c [Bacteroidetes bacterium]|nr:MAG: cytochrome c [Bacteroidota bacterium]